MNRTYISTIVSVLTAGVLSAQQPAPPAPAASQPPPVTFRVEVNYVEVDAIVTDAQGNPVHDLQARDFELLEDGKPQKITSFSLVNIPVERAERPLFAAAPIEPDVQDNRAVDGRVYLIVLDDLHVSPMRTAVVKAALREFLGKHFGANDIAAVVYTSGRGDAGQEFTNNRRLLLGAVDRFTGRKLRSPTLDRLEQYRNTESMRNRGERVDDLHAGERGYQARTAMDTLRQLAGYMAGVRGRRKAMLLISEGMDVDINDVFGNSNASMVLDASRDAIGAATRANVSIYAVDPRGLSTMGDAGIEVDSFPDDPATGITSTSMLDELRISQDSLRVLAGETGGFAAVNSNSFGDAFARIVRDNSTYYMLGYYPANDRRDGRFRKVEVRVTRPGLQVRSRRGYLAPRGRAQEPKAAANPLDAAVRDAMLSPLPITGLPMRVAAAAFRGEAPNAMVALAIELEAKDFRFEEKGGVFADPLEVSFTATDSQGKARPGDRHQVQLSLKPDTLPRVKANGFRVISQMALPPGRYQLRVAAAEGGGKAGSVFYDLEVPDFSKGPLAMSGIALSAASAGQTLTARAKDPLGTMLPGPPIAYREFARGDELALFAEFYENARGAPGHKVDITTTVRTNEGKVVLQSQEERNSSELGGGRGGYGYTTRLPLKDFAPGTYVIHVEARSRSAKDAAVGRDIQIRVR